MIRAEERLPGQREGLEQVRGRARDFITENWNLGVSSVDGVAASGKPVNVDEFGKCYGTRTIEMTVFSASSEASIGCRPKDCVILIAKPNRARLYKQLN